MEETPNEEEIKEAVRELAPGKMGLGLAILGKEGKS